MITIAGYSPDQFVPYTLETYLRLTEQVNQSYWPWHMLAVVAIPGSFLLAVKGRHRLAGFVTAIIWAWVGFGYIALYYAQLNWVGDYVAWAFYLQSGLILFAGLTRPAAAKPMSPVFWVAQLLCLTGLFWPFIFAATRDGWMQAEVAGMHADPFVLFSLGFIRLVFSGWRLFITAWIPIAWCLFSALNLIVLMQPQAYLLLAAVVLFLMAGAYTAIYDRKHRPF